MRPLNVFIIIIAALYVLSPIDLIPDLFPIFGWLDDAFLVGIMVYYLKRGSLPVFLSWLNRSFGSGRSRQQSYHNRATPNEKRHQTEAPKDPFNVLGIPPTADPDEIHRAYRRAVQVYHPDKVSHLGPEFKALAEKKFLEIQNAYKQLARKP